MIAAAAAALLRRPWLALALAVLGETLIFVACQGDFVVSDPLWYADVAHRISEDPAAVFAEPYNHPFYMRVGLTLPLALLYRTFGMSSLVTDLPGPLGVVLVVYAAAPTARAKVRGMLRCVTCVPLAREARLLHPDLPCAALMASAR